MNNITKILVPIDFSDYTDHVVKFAADLSQRYEAKMQLMHAWEPMTYIRPEGMIVLAQDQLEKTMADLKAQLEKVAIAARAAGAIQVEALVVNGYPASEIVRRASELNCGLIVMGTHGRTGIKHVLIGSVAENVVRTATCPVVTLRAASASD